MMPFLLLIFQIHFLSDGLTYDEHCMQTSWWRTMMNVIFTCQITWIHARKIWWPYSTNSITVTNNRKQPILKMRYYLFAGGVYSLEIIIIVVFWGNKNGVSFRLFVIPIDDRIPFFFPLTYPNRKSDIPKVCIKTTIWFYAYSISYFFFSII